LIGGMSEGGRKQFVNLGVLNVEPAYPRGCSCGSHAEHLVFRWLWGNPSGSLKDAAKDLHISHEAAKQRSSRVKKRSDISKRCPECFKPSLEGLFCRNCGAELDVPRLPDGVRFEETSPVHSIQPLSGLGSSTDYRSLGLSYGAQNVQHLVERPADPFVESCKSKLWEELKGTMPPDSVTEEATKLLLKEIAEFRARYPALARAKGAGDQLVRNVVNRLALRYPTLRRVTE
jgi:hypothetical protein